MLEELQVFEKAKAVKGSLIVRHEGAKTQINNISAGSYLMYNTIKYP